MIPQQAPSQLTIKPGTNQVWLLDFLNTDKLQELASAKLKGFHQMQVEGKIMEDITLVRVEYLPLIHVTFL